MGNDFGGTPNPLEPGANNNAPRPRTVMDVIPPAKPAGAMPQTTMPTGMPAPQPMPAPMPQPMAMPAPQPMPAPIPQPIAMPTSQPASSPAEANEATMGVVTNLDGTTPDNSLDPMNRPMEKAPTVVQQKPHKLRKGYLFGMLACLLVAVTCAVTAILLLTNKDTSTPVSKAIDKLLAGDTGNNFKLDGTIDITMPTGTVEVSLKSTLAADTLANSTDATISISQLGVNALTANISEIYTPSNDLYLKLSGIENLIGTSGAEMIDDAWIKTSTDTISGFTPTENSDSLTCFESFAEDFKNNQNNFKELYQDNAFIISSTEGIAIKSKHYPVYKLELDNEKLRNFTDNLNNFTPLKNLMHCAGSDNITINTSDISDEILAKIEDTLSIYVEVDNDDRFSRVYMRLDGDEGDFNRVQVEIDFEISYPSTINIVEPEEYIDLDYIMSLMPEGAYPFGDTNDEYEYEYSEEETYQEV